VTPNWHLRLPGFAYEGDEPDGYLRRADVVRMIDDYVQSFNPPLRLGVEVKSVEKNAGDNNSGFVVRTDSGALKASNVIVATGTFQRPSIPEFSQRIKPHITQVHSSRYKNPESMPPGAVLVVGSGQSGCQIAEELYKHGRKVYLSTGKAGRAPRRYRGKDFMTWFAETGAADKTVDELDSPAERFAANPQVSGRDGGHTLNLHRFAADGVTLLGRLQNADGSQVVIADDLQENLASSDEFAATFKKNIDKFIEKKGLKAPKDEEPESSAGYEAEAATDLDLRKAGIKSIVWATGYNFDFGLVRFPIFDQFGYPRQDRGITEQSGLYFLGLHWLHTIKSGLFVGVGDDAAHVTEHIAAR
jgi:putative flavoprotein involved in K+ transport